MSNRIYPRNVWVLHPSFKPVEVTVIGKFHSYGGSDYGDITAKGKRYALNQMFETMGGAIFAGRYDVARTQADIYKRQEKLNKQIAALDKAEGK